MAVARLEPRGEDDERDRDRRRDERRQLLRHGDADGELPQDERQRPQADRRGAEAESGRGTAHAATAARRISTPQPSTDACQTISPT